MGVSLYLLEQRNYQYLPRLIRKDVENERCPTDVAWELLGLWGRTHQLWGKRKAQDWVKRAYKRARKTSSSEKMTDNIKKYLEARGFEDIEQEWLSYSYQNKIVSGDVYILSSLSKPGMVKVGMVHSRTVDERLAEIQQQTRHIGWKIAYKRYTISVFEAESRAHRELPNRIHPRKEFFQVSHKKAISIVNRSIDQVEEEINSFFDWYMDRKMYRDKGKK